MGQTNYCTATADYTVTTNTTVNISTWFPSSSGTNSKIIEIQAGATLNINKSFAFAACKFRCGSGAVIKTDATVAGILLSAGSCQFFTCGDYLWQGITVNAGARIALQSCSVKDAYAALYFPPGYTGTANNIRHNTFENNLHGLKVGDAFSGSGGAAVGFNYCFGNTFLQSVSNIKGTFTNVLAGAYAVRNSTLSFGTPGGPKNTFRDMPYGIFGTKNSSLIVGNSDFRDMFSAGDTIGGCGIFASGSMLYVNGNEELSCVFEDNMRAGIVLFNLAGPTSVQYAQFSGDQRYGIFSQTNNKPATVDFSWNTFTLPQEPAVSAIYLERPPAIGSESVISFNTVDATEITDLSEGSLAALIDVKGNTGANDDLSINYNTVVNYTNEKWIQGIHISGAGDNTQVMDNTVQFLGPYELLNTGSPYEGFGISANDMTGEGTALSDNTVSSWLYPPTLGDDPESYNWSFIKCGIHVDNVNEPYICANDVDDTHRAFHLAKMLPLCVFGENTMHRHVHSLHCSNGLGSTGSNLTNIGNQVHRANIWSTNSSDILLIGVAALYADDTEVPFKFFVDDDPFPTLPSGQSYVPPSAIPAVGDWFTFESYYLQYCSQIDPNTPRFADSEIDIAKDVYPYGHDAEHWDQKRQLWYKLSRHPDWALTVDTDVKDFYENEYGTSPQRFAAALWQFEQAFAPSTGVAAALDTLHEQYRDLVADIIETEEDINADTVTLDGTAATRLNNNILALAGVAADISEAVDNYIADRDAKIEALQDTLAVLPDNNPWEQAWIALLEVAARRGLAEADEDMDQSDREALRDIAESCPQSVGLARQIAINYMPPGDANLYLNREYSEGCTEYSQERGKTTGMQAGQILLAPNPASQYVLARLPWNEDVNWQVLSSTGQVMAQGQIPAGQNTLSIAVSNFAAGFYLLQTQGPNGQLTRVRFSVVK